MRAVQKLLSLETSPQEATVGVCSMGGSGVDVQHRNVPAMHPGRQNLPQLKPQEHGAP